VAQRFALNLLVAFIPAVVLGLSLGKLIKSHLFHPVPVALAFIVGGLIILWVERRHRRAFGERDLEGRRLARVETVDDMTTLDALKVGLVQCLALIPAPAARAPPSLVRWCSASRASAPPSSASTSAFRR